MFESSLFSSGSDVPIVIVTMFGKNSNETNCNPWLKIMSFLGTTGI